LSAGSNNGDVDQSNDAKTIAASSNENETDQANEQEQRGYVAGDEHGEDGCGHKARCGHDKHRGHGCGHEQHRGKGCGHEKHRGCGSRR